MKVLVVGASGKSGQATVAQLLAAGHEVTAFARRPDRAGARSERLHLSTGDVMNRRDVDQAVQGHDAVIISLGISENPVRVRTVGPANTPIDVRSTGTRHVVSAMQKHGVRKLVVQSSYGVGETRRRLGLVDRLLFQLILKPQIADHEKQERAVRDSSLDWVIVQPVHLTNDSEDETPLASTEGDTATMKVSRSSVGRFIAGAALSQTFVGKSVALSGGTRADARVGAAAP